MQSSICRLLPFEARSGADNMAVDEVLLQAAERGVASLRFYTWNEPTLSLGYFQQAALRLGDPGIAGLAWVRRPSGGSAILHDRELTYCLALPTGPPWQGKESWVCRFHRLVASALQKFDVTSRAVACGEEKKLGDFLCFLDQTAGDLIIKDSKIAGSAQRKWRGALMQHGSVLLERSTFAAILPGVDELSGHRAKAEDLAARIAAAFASETGWRLAPDRFTDAENAEIVRISQGKYGSAAWNEKR